MTKVLGIEQFANKIGLPGEKGDTIGILFPNNTKIKRGDIIIGLKPKLFIIDNRSPDDKNEELCK